MTHRDLLDFERIGVPDSFKHLNLEETKKQAICMFGDELQKRAEIRKELKNEYDHDRFIGYLRTRCLGIYRDGDTYHLTTSSFTIEPVIRHLLEKEEEMTIVSWGVFQRGDKLILVPIVVGDLVNTAGDTWKNFDLMIPSLVSLIDILG